MSESIAFIVSVLDRAWFLNGCLASLAVNPDPKRVIVSDNAIDPATIQHIATAISRYGFEHCATGIAGAKECYESANWVVKNWPIANEWLCFPSDDSLYVCGFTEIMLAQARVSKADLVYCDCVYRSAPVTSSWKSYTVLDTQPRMGRIDKTCFIVRRQLFKGFPEHPHGWRDGALIEELIRDGVRHAKAPGILVLHQ